LGPASASPEAEKAQYGNDDDDRSYEPDDIVHVCSPNADVPALAPANAAVMMAMAPALFEMSLAFMLYSRCLI